jgi:uncharacterized membrane protein YkvA (DUF1232 family)
MFDVKCIKIKQSAVLPGIIFILSIFYLILPDDIIPDKTIVGWTDDFFIITATFLYLLEKTLSDHMDKLKNFVKKLKAVLIIAGTIAVAFICILFPDLTNIEKVFELYIKQIDFCIFCM